MQTNPYQIVSLPAAPLKPYTSWFEVGDLHDVLMVPVVSSNQAVGLRLQPGPYPGFEVLHCHLLSHVSEMEQFTIPLISLRIL